MNDLKPMSAAEYAAHADTQNAERSTVIKQLKSGAVFELRKPDLERMVILGLIPDSLLEIGMQAWESSGIKTKATLSNLDFATTQRGLIIMREVVADACVQPPFNEMTAKSFSKLDFNEIYHWAMGGEEVDAAIGLQRFREGPERRAAATGLDGTQLQPEAVSTAEN